MDPKPLRSSEPVSGLLRTRGPGESEAIFISKDIPDPARFEDITTFGNLMHKCGYQISSFIDEIVTEEFKDSLHLMEYLNKNGLNSAGKNDRNTVIRDVILGVNAVYSTLYSMPHEEPIALGSDGTQIIKSEVSTVEKDGQNSTPQIIVPASFHLLQFMGWKYHESQIQANERGTGSTVDKFIDDVLEDDEEAKKRVKFGSLEEEEFDEKLTYDPK